MKLRLGLWPYLFLTAALSIALGLGTVGLEVRQVADRQLSQYESHRDLALAQQVGANLQNIYQTNGLAGLEVGARHFAELLNAPITLTTTSGKVLLTASPGGDQGPPPPPGDQPVPSNPPTQRVVVPLTAGNHRVLAIITLVHLHPLTNRISPVFGAIESALLRASVVGFLVALALSALTGERVITPLRKISDGVRRLGSGDLSYRVPVGGPREVAALAENFNRMAIALEDSEHRRQQLIADTAHELRTPLSVLMGYLEAMRDGVEPVGESALSIANERAHQLAQLVNDLQDLAMADAHQLFLEKANLNVGNLVQQLVEDWRWEAEKRGIRLDAAILPDLPLCLADERRLTQVIQNLLVNALKFTPSGGEVHVSVTREDRGLRVSIRDTGPGIAKEHLPYIFDRLYRADPARGRDIGGAGLGLAIAKDLIELHGGRIGVQSEAGQGSEFWVEIPTS